MIMSKMVLDQFPMGITLKSQAAEVASHDVDQMYWSGSTKEFDEEVKYNPKISSSIP